ncbi:dystrotelin [Anolis sagrei]|uniref:dystrotelin n=1 Tax=Anolis sagrei TaxID=38937 RepID=UPI003521FA56
MDPDQQEALNVIPNSVYRTALKLRAVQSLCQLDLINVSLVDYILPSHSCQAEKQKPLPAEQLFEGLTELFKRASSDKPGQVEPKAPELTLRLLTAAYDRNGVGFIQLRSAAAALIALSGDSLPTKYRALFQLYAACSGRGSGSSLHITRTSVRSLLTDLLQLTVVVGEGHNMSHVENATHSCFSGVLNSAVGEERFLAWLWSEPTILLWLPTLYRLLATEMVTHKVKCNVCKQFPITGLRFRCLKCLNFDLCQTCFFTGQHCKPHKKSHPIIEHCRPVSARENIKLIFRIVRNNLLPGRCKRKEALRRKALGLMDNRDFSTQSQPHPSSIQLVSTGDPKPPDLFPAEHTTKVQLNHTSDAKASQVPSSLELEMAKTQESIKALQNENRHLRKQLTKWKNQVQALHSAQEDKKRRFDELMMNQENLKMELQKLRIEIKDLQP